MQEEKPKWIKLLIKVVNAKLWTMFTQTSFSLYLPSCLESKQALSFLVVSNNPSLLAYKFIIDRKEKTLFNRQFDWESSLDQNH